MIHWSCEGLRAFVNCNLFLTKIILHSIVVLINLVKTLLKTGHLW